MALKNEGRTISVITRTSERQCEWEFVEELAEVASQVVGVGLPSATPVAFAPRNEGQFWAPTVVVKTAMTTTRSTKPKVRRALLFV
jgi:hypothetical protein